jgi:hypothetical protein
MEVNDIYDRLRTFIELVINDASVTVVYANQNGPRPIKPFITISVGPVNTTGMPIKGDIDASGLQQVTSYMSFIGEFNAYSDELHYSEYLLSHVQKYFRTSIAFLHFAGDMSYLRTVSGVMTIPQVQGVVWENRALLEAEFSVTQSIIDNVGLIESVVITNNGTGKNQIINK